MRIVAPHQRSFGPLPSGTGGEGTVTVDVTPASGTWEIDGPLGHNQLTGTGDATYSARPSGLYRITYGDLTGYLTPNAEMGLLEDGGTLDFVGLYSSSQPGYEAILDRIVYLLNADLTVENYIVRSHIADDLSVDQMRIGCVEVDYEPDGETEIERFRQGLVKIEYRFRIRVTKIANGGEDAVRTAVEQMSREVINALESTNGNLAGYYGMRKHSVKFVKQRMDPVAKSGSPDAELNRRSRMISMRCVMHQNPSERT